MYVTHTDTGLYTAYRVWFEIKDYDSFSSILRAFRFRFAMQMNYKRFFGKFAIYIQELYKSYSYSFSLSLSLFVCLLHTKHENETKKRRTVLKRISSFLIDFSLFEKKYIKKNTENYADTHVHITAVRVCVCVATKMPKNMRNFGAGRCRTTTNVLNKLPSQCVCMCVCVGLGFDSPLALFMPHFALTSASTSPFLYLRFPLSRSLSLLLTRLAHSCA